MCGRFVSASPPERIAAYFGAGLEVEPIDANYNVAPTDDIYAVVDGRDGRVVRAFEWGLLPVWAKDRKVGQKMINARAETVATKFKGVFRTHRCIVPMDGFYEWQAAGPGGPVGKTGKPLKQPWFVHRTDGEPLAVAGLWSAWRPRGGDAPKDGGWVHTASVITTAANATMAPIHDRMPVVLPKAMWDLWLDRGNDHIDILASLLVPAPEHLLVMHRVSTDVNSVRNQGPHLIEPVELAG